MNYFRVSRTRRPHQTVKQLPDISRPTVGVQFFQSMMRKHFLIALEMEGRKQRNILRPFPQRRYFQAEHVNPLK